MAFTDKSNNLLQQRDLQFLEDMLKTSLEEHLKFLNENGLPSSKDPNFYHVIKQVFADARKQLSFKIQKIGEDKSNKMPVSDFISDFYNEIWKKLFEKINKNHPDYDKFILYLAGGFNAVNCAQLGNEELMAICRKNVIESMEEAVSSSEENERIALITKQMFDGSFGDKTCLPNQKDSYENSIASFRFADEPMEGIENLLEFHPNTDSADILFEGRKGNSKTLADQSEENEKETLADQSEENEKETLAFQKGTELAQKYASKWSNSISGKQRVTFGDLYETLTELHKAVQANSSTGGKLCGYPVHIGQISSPGSFVMPNVLYKILDTVADGMNQINKTTETALKKTRAVQLAAFAYQMLVSAHLLQGGNGRTYRLFADTILQTFGLPPHTPLPKEKEIGVTIGKVFDFQKGAELFLEGVKKSNDVLASQSKVKENSAAKEEQPKIELKQNELFTDQNTTKLLSGTHKGGSTQISQIKGVGLSGL